MNGDADIQVWLEQMTQTQPSMIVPYVESDRGRTLRYLVQTVNIGATGRAMMSQGGTIRLEAGVPTALGRMSVTRAPENNCFVELFLREAGAPERKYHFECPG